MTAQVPDYITYRRRSFDIAGINGTGLFDPESHGMTLESGLSSCWRGYVAYYTVHNRSLYLRKLELAMLIPANGPPYLYGAPRDPETGCYRNGVEPVPFTGGMLLGRDFVHELYVHMGFAPAWKYREVHELEFECGRLLKATDRSDQIALVRANILDSRDALVGPADLMTWIDRCFDRSYR